MINFQATTPASMAPVLLTLTDYKIMESMMLSNLSLNLV